MEKEQWPPPPRPRVVAPRRRITAHQRQAVPPFCVCNLNIFLAGLARFLGIVLATILAWLWAVINLQLCLALALAFRGAGLEEKTALGLSITAGMICYICSPILLAIIFAPVLNWLEKRWGSRESKQKENYTGPPPSYNDLERGLPDYQAATRASEERQA